MKQEEFRIGNWVNDMGKPVQISGLQHSGRIVVEDFMYDDGKRSISPEPIPITYDILDKTGFEKKGNSRYFESFFIYMPGSDNSDYGLGFKGIGLIRSVKYLHDLQNIIYCLSKKELPVNL